MSKEYQFTICEVKPKIFEIVFTEQYDLAMTFLRYQEYYESSSPKFKGKAFKLIDYMSWYSKEFSEKDERFFSYPIDWAGFNIPAKVICEVRDLGIEDYSDYDDTMNYIYQTCLSKMKNNSYNNMDSDNFYIIGTYLDGGDSTKDHEIAHGFFFTKSDYKEYMLKLVDDLPKDLLTKFSEELMNIGYSEDVIKDEIQAYMATGLPDFDDEDIDINNLIKDLAAYQKAFIKFFIKTNSVN